MEKMESEGSVLPTLSSPRLDRPVPVSSSSSPTPALRTTVIRGWDAYDFRKRRQSTQCLAKGKGPAADEGAAVAKRKRSWAGPTSPPLRAPQARRGRGPQGEGPSGVRPASPGGDRSAVQRRRRNAVWSLTALGQPSSQPSDTVDLTSPSNSSPPTSPAPSTPTPPDSLKVENDLGCRGACKQASGPSRSHGNRRKEGVVMSSSQHQSLVQHLQPPALWSHPQGPAPPGTAPSHPHPRIPYLATPPHFRPPPPRPRLVTSNDVIILSDSDSETEVSGSHGNHSPPHPALPRGDGHHQGVSQEEETPGTSSEIVLLDDTPDPPSLYDVWSVAPPTQGLPPPVQPSSEQTAPSRQADVHSLPHYSLNQHPWAPTEYFVAPYRRRTSRMTTNPLRRRAGVTALPQEFNASELRPRAPPPSGRSPSQEAMLTRLVSMRGRGHPGPAHISPGMMVMAMTVELGYEHLLELAEMLGPTMGGGLSKEEIDSIEMKCFEDNSQNSDDSEEESKHCVVCLSDYSKGDVLRNLRCGHDYHQQCIDRWFQRSSTCPICRADLRHVATASSS